MKDVLKQRRDGFALEALEPRVLLSGDTGLAAAFAVSAVQVHKPLTAVHEESPSSHGILEDGITYQAVPGGNGGIFDGVSGEAVQSQPAGDADRQPGWEFTGHEQHGYGRRFRSKYQRNRPGKIEVGNGCLEYFISENIHRQPDYFSHFGCQFWKHNDAAINHVFDRCQWTASERSQHAVFFKSACYCNFELQQWLK